MPIHAVVVRGAKSKDQARREAKKYVPKVPGFVRETSESYRVLMRIIPKTKFKKDSYRTKKINDNVSIIYGKLKNCCEEKLVL